jgi:hypothetical protein
MALEYYLIGRCGMDSKVVPLHAMNAYGGRGRIAPLIPNLSSGLRRVMSFTV